MKNFIYQKLYILFHRIQNSWVCIFMIFLWFYIDFTSSLFNVPWAPGPKCNFFTFRSCCQLDGRQTPCRPLGGDRHPFLKISLFDIYFWNLVFFNIKMKKAPLPATSYQRVFFQIEERCWVNSREINGTCLFPRRAHGFTWSPCSPLAGPSDNPTELGRMPTRPENHLST